MSLVYSTESGRLCPQCEQPVAHCQCKRIAEKNAAKTNSDGIVRLQRQTQGRGGKIVTTISGVVLPEEELKQLAKRLKQLCGSGGTVTGENIEIQGDHRATIKTELERRGFIVKLSGG